MTETANTPPLREITTETKKVRNQPDPVGLFQQYTREIATLGPLVRRGKATRTQQARFYDLQTNQIPKLVAVLNSRERSPD